MLTRSIALLAALCFSITSAAQAERLPRRTAKKIDAIVDRLMEDGIVPAVSVAVGRNGELVWARSYGTADLENGTPAITETKFRTASIDKWMTATAAMHLVERGQLDLDEDVRTYCPAYPKKRWTIPVKTLLNHTSGVRHYWETLPMPKDPEAAKIRQRQIEIETVMASVRYDDRTKAVDPFKDDPLLTEPGTTYRYTSHGYRLLGCVLEGASGTNYNDLMTTTIFSKAGMGDTVPDDAWAVIPHRVEGYSTDDAGTTVLRASMRDVSENLPAGGHLSTSSDLVRFAMAWNSGDLVSGESKKAMTKASKVTALKDKNGHYGYGVAVHQKHKQVEKDITLLRHGGGQAGTATLLLLAPDDNVAVAVMMNQDEASRDFAYEILNLLLD